jgi:hypothetical protein
MPDLAMPDLAMPDLAMPDLAQVPLVNAWQSLQRSYRTAGGTTCNSRVTLGVGDQAVCYEASDDTMKCAGTIYMTGYGSGFTATGRSGVDQILLSGSGGPGGYVMTHQVDNTVWSMGVDTSGVFGVGGSGSGTSFMQWGPATRPIVNIATGTFDQMCALDNIGSVWCTGNGQSSFGNTPALQAVGSGHTTVWVNTAGIFTADDSSIVRAGEGRTECTVTSAGLSCSSGTYGTPSAVLMGGKIVGIPGVTNLQQSCDGACWLESGQTVQCAYCNNMTPVQKSFFTSVKAISIGTNANSDTVCIVGVDGSVWCIGSNKFGQLGVGNSNPVSTETQVQPPGSAFTACH